MDVELLTKALEWALDNGAHKGYGPGMLMDAGCGCCSGTLEVPEDLKPVFAEVIGWKENG